MKAVRYPRAGSHPKLPSTRHVEVALRIALVFVLFGTALWYALWLAAHPNPAPTSGPGAGELILSGAVTTSLGAHDFEKVQCGPLSFQLETARHGPFPLELNFTAPPTAALASGSYYLLGSGEESFTLKVGDNAFTLLSGTLLVEPHVRSFSASLIDENSQPLWVSGRVQCPPAIPGRQP